ncbi:MAG: GNAT family N-acetyltransferase [Woeseiaceae bacterium]|nr:GNAT family N-acetyltransferase [Woeseiaceae bacterium]
MTSGVSFRAYSGADKDACLRVFDANCPAFFAPNERRDYVAFLEGNSAGYEVCELDGRVVGAFGLLEAHQAGIALCWIMLEPHSQGAGIGSEIMSRVISKAKASRSPAISISASQKSAPFFAEFGAIALSATKNGWGPGLDRVDMELTC